MAGNRLKQTTHITGGFDLHAVEQQFKQGFTLAALSTGIVPL